MDNILIFKRTEYQKLTKTTETNGQQAISDVNAHLRWEDYKKMCWQKMESQKTNTQSGVDAIVVFFRTENV